MTSSLDSHHLVQYLHESPPSFTKIKDALDNLGWRIVYETYPTRFQKSKVKSYVEYFLAPSANTKEGGYAHKHTENNVSLNREILTEGVDFFNLDEKKALYEFLLATIPSSDHNSGSASSASDDNNNGEISIPNM